MNWKNTVALVTGANRGLGKEIAEALSKAGVKKVYGGARDPLAVKSAGVIPVKLDVTHQDEIEAAARSLGDVNLVINNAGIYRAYEVLGTNEGDPVRDTFEANVFGVLDVSRAFAPVLLKNGGGAIANVLSVLSWVAFPGTLVYSASKAAAWMVTEGLRAELGPQGVQVTGIHAGYIDTDMMAQVDVPKNDPQVVAQKILAGLARGDQEILIDDISAQVKSSLSGAKPAFSH